MEVELEKLIECDYIYDQYLLGIQFFFVNVIKCFLFVFKLLYIKLKVCFYKKVFKLFQKDIYNYIGFLG